MAQYITTALAKDLWGIPSGDTEKDTAIGNTIIRASALIDQWTHTWWDSRTRTVRTKAITSTQKRLFMPAHIISITSIKEGGTLLTVDDYIVADSWLEKPGGYWSSGNESSTGNWVKYGVEVIGAFGYQEDLSSVPEEIQQLAAEVANMMGGWKTKTITQDDGIEKTVFMTELPEWAKDVIFSHKLGRLAQQQMVITT